MNDFSGMLLGDLRDAVRNWNRLLTAGLLFALLGHFYVVEPYFRHKAAEQRIRIGLIDRTNAVQRLTQELDRLELPIRGVTDALADVRAQINKYPDHLRARLPEIQKALEREPASIQRQSPPRKVGNFTMPQTVTDFQAGVRWYVDTWFSTLTATVDSKILQPVRALGSNAPALTTMTSTASDALRRYLDKVDPEFWRDYTLGKSAVAEELKKVVEQFFGPIEKQMTGIVQQTRENLQQLEVERQRLDADLKAAQQQSGELAGRLQSLESPLGHLPVGVADLITLFPILVAALTIMLTLQARHAHRLRVALDRSRAASEPAADGAVFELCAGTWFLPPHRGLLQSVMPAGLVLLFGAVVVRAAWLVMARAGDLSSAGLEVAVLHGALLQAAYVVAAVAVVASIGWWLRIGWQRRL